MELTIRKALPEEAESLSRIAELVAHRFGPEVGYDCQYVDTIPQESSGKYRFCISRVPNAFSENTRPQAAFP